MGEKEARPKGCSGREGKRTNPADGVDLVLPACHSMARSRGGLSGGKTRAVAGSDAAGAAAAAPSPGRPQSREGRGHGAKAAVRAGCSTRGKGDGAEQPRQ